MSDKPTILVQFDTDPLPSVFDRVVAVDAGAQQVFSYGGITAENMVPLIHGCIFTRRPDELKRTAIFIGGSVLSAGESLFAEVRNHMLPSYGLTVSVMIDSNGANTTAAAAVRSAGRHVNLATANSLILGGTGPVGQRVARLLARLGGHVRIGSRQRDRADAVCALIRNRIPDARVEAVAVGSSGDGPKVLEGRDLVFAAGAAGAVLLPKKVRESGTSLRVAVDLNGVPPAGIEGVELTDRGAEREGVVCYGALGVGGLKMKVHRAAVAELFARNDAILDAEEMYELALKQP